jgi:hypothetical protein
MATNISSKTLVVLLVALALSVQGTLGKSPPFYSCMHAHTLIIR